MSDAASAGVRGHTGGRGKSVRGTVEAVVKRLRDETTRVGETAETTLTGLARELGFVTRTEFDELELRLAQLEHRLRLLEHPVPPEPPR